MPLGGNQAIATSSKDNFLDMNPRGGGSILNITEECYPFDLNEPFELSSEEGIPIFPKPGFCIKSKTNKEVKVFINMCHSEDVPKPPDNIMSPKEDWDENEAIRLPLGLGLPFKEKDKSGNECICFDVIINTEFLDTLLKNEDARSFVLSLCIQGIADKYGIFVRDDCCIKLSKPYHGNMQRHFVKNTDSFNLSHPRSGSSAPLIRLMESSPEECKAASDNSSALSVRPKKSKYSVQSKVVNTSSAKNQNPLSVISESSCTKILPKKQKPDITYGLFQVPASSSYPLQYVLEAHMQCSLNDDEAQLQILASTNRIVITEKTRNYNIDVSLPNPVIPGRCRANFSDGTLVVVLPLAHTNHDED